MQSAAKQLFESAVIGGIKARNRIVRSATFESYKIEGDTTSPAMKEMYKALADGEVGTIITGFMCVSSTDNPSDRTVVIDSDDTIPALAELAQIVHDGGSRIVAQIAHIGSQLTSPPIQEVLAASDVVDPVNGIKPTPFSTEQIQTLVKEFGDGASRLKKAGFDGVQIHAAHGYLLSKFLSPIYNKRDDEYGGSPEKNVRIIMEIIDAIKTACGKDFPVWIKLNASDFGYEDNAYSPVNFYVTAKAIAKAGIDAIEVSGGTMTGKFFPSRTKSHEAYHLEYANTLAEQMDVPIIPVGGFRKLDAVETALEGQNIVAVSMSRPLVREPNLTKRWAEGDRSDAACVACNGCFNPKGARCFFELKGEEREAQKEVMKMMKAMRANNGK